MHAHRVLCSRHRLCCREALRCSWCCTTLKGTKIWTSSLPHAWLVSFCCLESAGLLSGQCEALEKRAVARPTARLATSTGSSTYALYHVRHLWWTGLITESRGIRAIVQRQIRRQRQILLSQACNHLLQGGIVIDTRLCSCCCTRRHDSW